VAGGVVEHLGRERAGLVVALGLLAPFAMARWNVARRWPPVAAPLLALLGVLALRAVVIFSAQS